MIKKFLITTSVFTTLLVITLLISNWRYSFYPAPGSGWSIGYKKISNPLDKFEPTPSQILNPQWLNLRTSQNTKFLADPFILYENKEYYIFFEHQAEGNANIGLLKSIDGKIFEYVGEVLDEDFHLSFPQVFKYKNEFYMLPETRQANQLLLYKAANFPFEWKIEDTLIKNVSIQDPVLLITDSLYLISGRTENLIQYVFTADSLKGEWTKDERFSLRKGDETRAAGNFFEVENRYFIPFQKSHNGYGSGVSLYEIIIEENIIQFKEIIDSYLGKSEKIEWFNKGMHHISVAPVEGNFFSVFDGDRINNSKPRKANWKGSLKYNFYDLMNFLEGKD